MKLSCTQENLHIGLSIVGHLPTKNINLPILFNILLKAHEKIFTLSATNLEIAIITTIRGKVDEPGEFTVPGKLFSDYSNLLPKERVDLGISGNSLEVKCGTYQTKLRGISATEFPLIPTVISNDEYQFKINDFQKALNQVVFSVASHESRPELCGVCAVFDHQQVTFVATDSFRLAEKVIPLDIKTERSSKVIIPARTISEILRIISIVKESEENDNEIIKIGISENQIVLKIQGTELISRTIDGKYPDYRQIIPEKFKTEVSVDRISLLQAVKNAALFSRSGLHDITIKTQSGKIILSANDQQTGENTIELSAEVSGDQNNVTINHRYLIDGIQSMDTEKIRLKIIDGANPMILTPESSTTHLYIVMPIRQ